jgi:hypothetical protein
MEGTPVLGVDHYRIGVEVTNLRKFLYAVGQSDKQIKRDLYRGLARAGRIASERASQVAPVRTGRLAAGYYVRVRGSSGDILNRQPYAAGAEWGLHGKWKGFRRYPAFGTGASRGRGRFAWRAVVEKREEIRDAVTRELQRAIELLGWAEKVA